MRQSRVDGISKLLERFAVWTTTCVGSSWAFLTALALTVVRPVTGSIFHFSDTWQFVMNNLSSIVAFLMVLLL
jgi:low affinity Fe/Cu permease